VPQYRKRSEFTQRKRYKPHFWHSLLLTAQIIGAELFAKRRKRSEKWVVGETNGTRPSSIPDIAPSPTPILSPLPPISSFPPPSYLPETAQRIQHKEKLDEIQVND
jgi:hypothetical protein